MVEGLALALSIIAIGVSYYTWRRTHDLELDRDEARRTADRAVRIAPEVRRVGGSYFLRITNHGPGDARDLRLSWNGRAIHGDPCFILGAAPVAALAPMAWIDIRAQLEALPEADDRRAVIGVDYVDSAQVRQTTESEVTF